MSRRSAIRAAIVILPFVVLFGAVRVVGPALARWKRERLLPGYATHDVTGRAASFTVWLHERRGKAEAEHFASAMDDFIARVTAPEAGFGLVAPDKPIVIMLFETSQDLNYYAGTVLHNRLVHNDGFYYPPTREIGLRRKDNKLEDYSPAEVAAGLRHEAAHLLFDLNSARGLSPWLTEGLACYFEEAGGPGGAPGDYGAIAALVLKSGKPLGIAAVLEADQAVFSAKENAPVYAAAAVTVTWLLDHAGSDLRAKFLEHLASQRAGGPKGRSALERSLGMTAEELDARVTAWARASKFLEREG